MGKTFEMDLLKVSSLPRKLNAASHTAHSSTTVGH